MPLTSHFKFLRLPFFSQIGSILYQASLYQIRKGLPLFLFAQETLQAVRQLHQLEGLLHHRCLKSLKAVLNQEINFELVKRIIETFLLVSTYFLLEVNFEFVYQVQILSLQVFRLLVKYQRLHLKLKLALLLGQTSINRFNSFLQSFLLFLQVIHHACFKFQDTLPQVF